MAHRIITQVIVTGTRVFSRAFAEAYRQASASSAYQKATGGTSQSGRTTAAHGGMTLGEACQILNVKPPKAGKAELEHVTERFKKLFDANDPKKGGSFYLQSKILRARERIESDIKAAEEAAERETEMRQGWRPKVYRE